MSYLEGFLYGLRRAREEIERSATPEEAERRLQRLMESLKRPEEFD